MSETKQQLCPVCRKAKAQKFAPFCSAGCKDRDLLQWLGEGYKVPGPAAPTDQLMNHFDGENGREGDG